MIPATWTATAFQCIAPALTGGLASFAPQFYVQTANNLVQHGGSWYYGYNPNIWLVSNNTPSLGFAFAAPSLSSVSPTTVATAGTSTLTISGVNFVTNITTVRINGLSVAGAIVAPQTITVKVPVGQGVGVPLTVVVNSSAGLPISSQASNQLTFSYIAPVISGVQLSSTGTFRFFQIPRTCIS